MDETRTIRVAAVLVFAAACNGPAEVPFKTLEDARTQARENASWNAQHFRQTDPRVEGLNFIPRGDSTQMPDCPQGDGWASVDFVKKDGSFFKVKCSTVSVAVGCVEAEEFKGKSYNSEENHCAPTSKVPFPLPKLTQ
jgi:hypothetical protein